MLTRVKLFLSPIKSFLSPVDRYRRKILLAIQTSQYEEIRTLAWRGHPETPEVRRFWARLFPFFSGRLLEALHGKDYFQFFGSFTEALQARKSYQDFVTRRANLYEQFWVKADIERIALERLEIPVAIKTAEAMEGSESFFEDKIRGQRVLIVGPATTVNPGLLDVGNFDVIAAPKLTSGIWFERFDKQRKPGSLLVSYLNGGMVAQLGQDDVDRLSSCSFVRVKTDSDVSSLKRRLRVLGSKVEVGMMKSPHLLMMNDYGPYMGPAVIFDILGGLPKEVFVTGFSFYLPVSQKYAQTYPTSAANEQNQVVSLRGHEPFSNFCFVKNLWQFGLISVDEAMAEILGMSREDYARALDQHFGLAS